MKLIFAGTPEIAAVALRKLSALHEVALVITREDAPVGRKRVITPSPVALAAAALGLKTIKCNRLDAGIVGKIAETQADLGIVIAFGALIPKSALLNMSWWNLHFSLLPAWRGAAPLQYSMMNLGAGAGISLFELEEGLDTGPIVAQSAMAIDPDKTYGEHLEMFTEQGVDLILQALEQRPQALAQQGEASLAPKLTRELSRLDLNQSAELVAAKVMALNPEPVAWAQLADEPFRVLRAKSLGSTNWAELDGLSPQPGRVSMSTGRVLLECGGGTRVELITVQPSGKKEMSAGDWFRGLNKEVILD
jgi:methionyl-tRNA formyltransferase